MTRPDRTRLIAAGLLAALLPASAMAGEVRGREGRQQGRIAHGISSGQITAGGANHLEAREGALNARRRADLAANGGHLTAGEAAHLNARENRISNSIYRDKHNDIAQPGVVPYAADH